MGPAVAKDGSSGKAETSFWPLGRGIEPRVECPLLAISSRRSASRLASASRPIADVSAAKIQFSAFDVRFPPLSGLRTRHCRTSAGDPDCVKTSVQIQCFYLLFNTDLAHGNRFHPACGCSFVFCHQRTPRRRADRAILSGSHALNAQLQPFSCLSKVPDGHITAG